MVEVFSALGENRRCIIGNVQMWFRIRFIVRFELLKKLSAGEEFGGENTICREGGIFPTFLSERRKRQERLLVG